MNANLLPIYNFTIHNTKQLHLNSEIEEIVHTSKQSEFQSAIVLGIIFVLVAGHYLCACVRIYNYAFAVPI